MIKKSLSKMFAAILAATLTLCTTVSAVDFTEYKTHTIDNDDDNDEGIGYHNSRSGFDTWFQNSKLFYGDARKHTCDSSFAEYVYYFPLYTRYTSIYGKISAYLYNTSFTDPSATYGIGDTYTYYLAVAGTINQDLAAAGWNEIGTAQTTHYFPDTQKYTSDCVKVIPSEEAGKNCGADAIKVVIGY
jgi:hypothetical protein